MNKIIKRVASAVMKNDGEDGLAPSKKRSVSSVDEEITDASKMVESATEERKDESTTECGDAEKKSGENDNVEEDDDLFEDLNEPTARVIHKVSEMQVGKIYQLVDIYSLQVEERLAIVGGFQLENEDVLYVWMPTSLVRNYDAKKVVELKEKILKGKKGYAMYNGMKQSKYGTPSYDVVWVQKKKTRYGMTIAWEWIDAC